MSIQRLYRTSRPARWAIDVFVVTTLIGTLAVLHTLPSIGLITTAAWGNL